MSKLGERLDKLREVTQDLAKDVKNKPRGPTFDFATFLLEQIRTPAYIINETMKIIYHNEAYEDWFGNSLGRKCFESIDKKAKCDDCEVLKSIKSREVITSYSRFGGKMVRKVIIPLVYNGVSGSIILLEGAKR